MDVRHISVVDIEAEEPLVDANEDTIRAHKQEVGLPHLGSVRTLSWDKFYKVALSLTAIGLFFLFTVSVAVHYAARGSVQVHTGGLMRLNAMPQSAPLTLEVGTATLDYSETGSAVTAQFYVAGAWTPDQSLFSVAHKGEVLSTSVMVSEWPTQLRLTIHGTDAYGMKSIKMTFAGETRTLLDTESADGEEYPSTYGGNQFWLDGDDNALPRQIYLVPGSPLLASPEVDASTSPARLFSIAFSVVVIWLVAIAALYYFYREELLTLLGRRGISAERTLEAPVMLKTIPPRT